jgi:hypothetical protein
MCAEEDALVVVAHSTREASLRANRSCSASHVVWALRIKSFRAVWRSTVLKQLERNLPVLILTGVIEKLAVFAFHFDRSTLCVLTLDAQHTWIKGPSIGRHAPDHSSTGAVTMARMRHNRPFGVDGRKVRFPWSSRTFAAVERPATDVRSPRGRAEGLVAGFVPR